MRDLLLIVFMLIGVPISMALMLLTSYENQTPFVAGFFLMVAMLSFADSNFLKG